MSVIILESGAVRGPFKSIEALADRLRCDGVDYCFTVIGGYTISEDDSLAPAPVTAVSVPAEVSDLDALLTLDAAGLSTAYEAWANDPARTFAERAFIQRARVWRRDDPVLNAAAAALGLSDADVDALFIRAAAI